MRISDWSSDVCSSDLLPTDEQIAVHIQDIALNLFVSDVTKEDAVNNSIPAASSTNGSIDPNVVDGMQALRTGLGLMRASQLTMDIGREHDLTPVTNAQLECRLVLEKKNQTHNRTR